MASTPPKTGEPSSTVMCLGLALAGTGFVASGYKARKR